MITVYEYGPTRSARCLWVLRELGIPFATVEVDLSAGEHRGAAFCKLNPFGRVPVLVDGDTVITESVAICLYLADRYGEGRLVPAPGTPQRAVHDQWLLFVVTELDAPLWRIRRNTVLLPEDQRVPGDVHRAGEDFKAAARVLQDALASRRFLAGDEFTVTDIVAVHTLFWSTWSDLLADLPGLRTYMEAHLTRESCPPALLRRGSAVREIQDRGAASAD